jgi:UDP-N-acetylglucosamine 2-epimerase (non-hydrolysing)
MKICIVLSTRPELIKFSPLIEIFKKKKINFFLVNTNQHYRKLMSKVFFNFFKIPKPKYNIKMGTNSQIKFFSKSILNLEKIFNEERPDILIVQGDTNTALSVCLAASIYTRKINQKNKKIKIVHLEAGLRSYNNFMPEEINRRLIDQLSDILFVPTFFDLNNLKKENLLKNKKIFTVGNTISDVIKKYKNNPFEYKILNKLQLTKNNYYLLTLHRPETVDDTKNLKKLLNYIDKLGKKYDRKFIFPVHPRTKKKFSQFNINKLNYIKFIEPLEFIDFLNLMKNSSKVFTDSGGIQEETSLLGVPCITLRTTTERQSSLKEKTNILTSYNYNRILNAIKYFHCVKIKPSKTFGNGNVANKIYDKLIKFF